MPVVRATYWSRQDARAILDPDLAFSIAWLNVMFFSFPVVNFPPLGAGFYMYIQRTPLAAPVGWKVTDGFGGVIIYCMFTPPLTTRLSIQ